MDAKMKIDKIKEKKTIKDLIEFGIIVFDKPADCTSFDVSDFVRKELRLRKTSHFGTLDPMVTGVLPISLNRATKLTGFFLGEDKEYIGTMRIHEDVSLEDIKKVIDEKFMGTIIQLPPVRSRVKRQERERDIKKFELLKKDGKEVSFLVECQGGTYVRKLVHDLGEEMKIGAHMIGLKRIRAGIFTDKQMTSKEEFEKAVDEYEKGNEKPLREIIIPAEIVSEIYPVVEVKEEPVGRILHGQPLYHKDLENGNLQRVFHNSSNPTGSQSFSKLDKDKVVCAFSGSNFVGMFKIVSDEKIFGKPMFVFQDIRN
jgi:H/ACA ribonucleoprotein complex subunit 4